jgi:hypothetical protein
LQVQLLVLSRDPRIEDDSAHFRPRPLASNRGTLPDGQWHLQRHCAIDLRLWHSQRDGDAR